MLPDYYHLNLLDRAKKHFTNFQLKSAENSEILPKKVPIFEVFVINLQSYVKKKNSTSHGSCSKIFLHS